MSENQIAGKNSILEALKSGTPVNRIYIRDTLKFDETIRRITRLAKENGVPFDVVNSSRLKSISKNGRDIIATISPVNYFELEEVLSQLEEKAVLIILDQITDPYNLGAVIRSAECFGADAVIISKRSSCPITSVVTKASAGALLHVPIVRVTNISNTIDTLKKHGFWVYGTSPNAYDSIVGYEFAERTGIVIGSEGKGMRDSVTKHCDILLKIPMHGSLNSLNASVSSGILLYEITRG